MPSTEASAQQSKRPIVLLQVVQTLILTPGGSRTVNIILDSGSQQSFISAETTAHLPQPTSQVDLHINNLGDTIPTTQYPIHSVQLKCLDGTSQNLSVIELHSILPPLNIKQWHQGPQHFPHLPLQQYVGEDFRVDLLLGSDQLSKVELPVVERKGSLLAKQTRLGWTLQGPLPNTTSYTSSATVASLVTMTPPEDRLCLFSASTSDQEVDQAMSKFLKDLDQEAEESKADDDSKILHDFYSQICRTPDNHYQVPLLRKSVHPPLPDNLELAKKWLTSVTKKLKLSNLYDTYCAEISRQLKENVIEQVGQLSSSNSGAGYSFLPHFPVLRPGHKTTPLRVVFAANAGHISLNDTLSAGPSLLQDLATLLRKFRTHKVALSGDLRKAFNSLEVKEEDRKVLQFLWYDAKGNLTVFRHRNVQFGPSCSPFLLFATLNFHLMVTNTKTSLKLLTEFYSDNLVTGCDTEVEALSHITSAIDILAEGKFVLRDCRSNSKKVNDHLQKIGKLNPSSTLSVLGLTWDSTKDSLAFSIAKPVVLPLTKRKILSFTAGIFDPLGLLIYATTPCMQFITKLWVEGLKWDDPLPASFAKEWKSLEKHAIEASKSVLHRHHDFDHSKPINLCVFTDASQASAAALAYLHQGSKTALVGGKYKIFSLTKPQGMTIPRKELTALHLGAKFVKKLLDTYAEIYPQLKTHVFSDSEIALFWLLSNKEQETFVANRVHDIKKHSKEWKFYHVPSKENPSDLPTRGTAPHEVTDKTLYHLGPHWLAKGKYPAQWCPESSGIPDLITLAMTHDPAPKAVGSLYNLIDPGSVSSYEKLMNITSILLQPFHPTLTKTARLNRAALSWAKDTQKDFFSKELAYLQTKQGPIPSLVKTLRLFLDSQGVLRCQGRFANSNLPETQKFPILLPSSSKFTELLLKHLHETNKHLGLMQLMSMSRRTFWIPHLRARCSQVISRCTACLKVQGKPFKTAAAPDLPSNRLNLIQPYRSVGMDYTGSIAYKSNNTLQKGYILILSCTVSRHVHLQLVSDMSASALIQALRFHCAIYGTMHEILCDNAQTFVSADTSLKEIFSQVHSSDVASHLAGRRIKFNFIPKRAPWWGAHYERLIGILKSHLRKSIGRLLLTKEDLTVCLAEIASVMNERPLTTLVNDPESLDPITPNLLVFGHHLDSIPYPEFQEDDFKDKSFEQPTAISDLYSTRALVRHNFLQRFQEEYLAYLRERHSYDNKLNNHTSQAKVGDVCLIHGDNPRKFWNLGLITKVIPGPDGQVRVAEIRTQTGTTNRPLQKLYPIGVSHTLEEVSGRQTTSNQQPENDSEGLRRRPKRNAAVLARQRITDMLNSNQHDNI